MQEFNNEVYQLFSQMIQGELKYFDLAKKMEVLYPKYLEKEKEQIENVFDMGRDETTRKFIEDGEEYYNQTYNQNK